MKGKGNHTKMKAVFFVFTPPSALTNFPSFPQPYFSRKFAVGPARLQPAPSRPEMCSSVSYEYPGRVERTPFIQALLFLSKRPQQSSIGVPRAVSIGPCSSMCCWQRWGFAGGRCGWWTQHRAVPRVQLLQEKGKQGHGEPMVWIFIW